MNINVPGTTNNEIKKVKRKYFTENLKSSKSNPKKTWKLINELNSRHPNKVKNISEIKVREKTITEPSEIAEKLNLHGTFQASVGDWPSKYRHLM